MRVSLEWLQEYVDVTGLSPEEIAEALTNAGLEVETIETIGGAFSDVLVGKITVVEPHPNADRLRLVRVNLGNLGENQVVCGAPNVAVDMHIAYAQVGARVINRKEGGLFELKPVTIRGVQSTGMICSLEELGLEDDYPKAEDGIWPIDNYVSDTDLGKDLKAALGLKTDIVLDVTPTANRGDQMSMWGVAREVAALFKRPLTFNKPKRETPLSETQLKISLEDPSVCPYYWGGVLENIRITESPEWMKRRLTNAGIRSINNVVDVTNYVMLEMGQPLHAFDIDKLGTSGTVGVRRAKPSEELECLDEVTRPLQDLSVVVTFNDRPVALAGVMGGEETAISETTQRVFLECAYFPPSSNRKSARSVGIRTESSARFERGVDPQSCEAAFYRAIELLEQCANGTLKSIAKDKHLTTETQTVTLSLPRVERILGLSIPQPEIERILMTLGFQIEAAQQNAEQLHVLIPSFRSQDVAREIDLIEEIIRIYGYDAIPYSLPQETATPAKTFRAHLLEKTRHLLTGSGLAEVLTHSLIGEALLQRTGFTQNPETTVRVSNSQSIDHTFMRQSLIPNLLEVAHHNQAQGNEEVWIFELGKIYVKKRPAMEKTSGVDEPLTLSGLLMSNPVMGQWHRADATDFYTVKGVLENLFTHLGLLPQCILWSSQGEIPSMHPGQTAQINLGKDPLGFVGRLHPAFEETLKFKHPLYVFELHFETIYKHLKKLQERMAVEALSAFPLVKRDFAFSAPKTVTHQEILAVLEKAQEPLLQDVFLFDEYQGSQLETGHRSLAYRLTFQSMAATLTEKEIDAAVEKLKRQLTDQLPVAFR
jgi:phenylalanyl-tRNA synthetase beta chain